MNGLYPLLGKSVAVHDPEGHITEGTLLGIRLKAGLHGQADRFEYVLVETDTGRIELRGDLTLTEVIET
jgi:hypothetical protein